MDDCRTLLKPRNSASVDKEADTPPLYSDEKLDFVPQHSLIMYPGNPLASANARATGGEQHPVVDQVHLEDKKKSGQSELVNSHRRWQFQFAKWFLALLTLVGLAVGTFFIVSRVGSHMDHGNQNNANPGSDSHPGNGVGVGTGGGVGIGNGLGGMPLPLPHGYTSKTTNEVSAQIETNRTPLRTFKRDFDEESEEPIDFIIELIEVIGQKWDEMVENIPKEDWPKPEEVVNKFADRLREQFSQLPPFTMTRRRARSQNGKRSVALLEGVQRNAKFLLSQSKDSCVLTDSSQFPLDSDLLKSIGLQIGGYPQEQQRILVKIASETVVSLLTSRQIQACSSDDLDQFAAKLASKIRQSISTKRSRDEPEDSIAMELEIFRLRVITVMFHHTYPRDTLQSYIEVFVDSFPVLSLQHSPEEVIRFLVEGLMQLDKLSQVTTYQQYLDTWKDMVSSLATYSEWPVDQVTRLSVRPVSILSSFFRSSASERIQQIGRIARQFAQGFDKSSDIQIPVEGLVFDEAVKYVSELMDDFERYYHQFFQTEDEIHVGHLESPPENTATKITSLKTRQDREGLETPSHLSPNSVTAFAAETGVSTPAVATSVSTDPPKASDATTTSANPSAAASTTAATTTTPTSTQIPAKRYDKKDDPWWFSTQAIIVFALTLALIVFALLWFLIVKCCFRPSNIRKSAGTRGYRVCRRCKKTCDHFSQTCGICNQPTTKPRFQDLWVWRWKMPKKSKQSKLPIVIPGGLQSPPPMTYIQEPLISLDGTFERQALSGRPVGGSELKVAKRAHNSEYYLPALRLPDATFHTVRKYSGISPDVDGLPREMAAAEKHIHWGSTT